MTEGLRLQPTLDQDCSCLSLKPSGREELREFVRSVKQGEHGCLIYEDEEQMWDLEAEYLREGIKQGELGVALTVKESMNEVRDLLRRHGVDVDKHVGDGSLLIVDSDQLYVSRENPDIEAWLNAAKSVVDNAVKNGKKGVRIAGLLSNHFLRKGFSDQWFRLESSLHRTLNMPCSAICGYDVSELAPSERPFALREVLEHYRRIGERNPQVMDAHSFAIFASGEGGAIAQLPMPVY